MHDHGAFSVNGVWSCRFCSEGSNDDFRIETEGVGRILGRKVTVGGVGACP
jgi:hypothetical protein